MVSRLWFHNKISIGSQIQTSSRVRENKYGQMDPCMKAGGTTTKQMEEVDLSTLMETYTMVFGWMTRLMDLECIAIWTVQNMRVNGKKTNSTVKELKPGLMVRDMRDNTSKAKSTVLANLPGLMAACTKASSSKTTSKVKASTTGLTEENTTVRGWITKWRARVCSHGPTAESTRETTSTTRRKVKGSSTGQTAGSMSEGGQMASSTESGLTRQHRAKRRRASGRTASDWTGCRRRSSWAASDE